MQGTTDATQTVPKVSAVPSSTATQHAAHAAAAQDATQTAPTRDLAPILDPIVAQAMDEFGLLGLTIGVRMGDASLFIKAYGYADLTRSTDVDPATIYPIASVTKQFTAAAIMGLVEMGRINLDDSISGFIPDVPAAWAGVTVRHLLNHTAGLPDLSQEALASVDVYHEHTVAEVVALIKEWSAELAFPPGSSFAYSSVGYGLLGAVIERASGMTYGEYLQENILDPLGLSSTRYAMMFPPNMAQGHLSVAGELQPVTPGHPSLAYAAGGIVSSARDLLKWQQALAQGRVVSPESYKLMITPTTLPSGREVPYGFGLRIGGADCSNAIHHNGSTPGFESYLLYCPDNNMGLVLLLNSTPADVTAVETLVSRLTRALLSEPP